MTEGIFYFIYFLFWCRTRKRAPSACGLSSPPPAPLVHHPLIDPTRVRDGWRMSTPEHSMAEMDVRRTSTSEPFLMLSCWIGAHGPCAPCAACGFGRCFTAFWRHHLSGTLLRNGSSSSLSSPSSPFSFSFSFSSSSSSS